MRKSPCKLDHNGECLICDCGITECAWDRFLNMDFKYETKEELELMFKDFKKISGVNLVEDELWDHYSGLPNPMWWQHNNRLEGEEDNTSDSSNMEIIDEEV